MSNEQLDLGSVVSIVRRRRRVVAVAALVGAIVGVLFVLARPPLYTSSTTVLLPPQQSSGGTPTARDMGTESRIAMSDAVLDPAREAVSPKLTRAGIAALVSVSSPSQNMLQIQAQGQTRLAAEDLARAVANSELAYEQQASSSLSAAEQDTLKARQTSLEKQLAEVNKEISSTKQLLGGKPPKTPQARNAQTALAQLTAQATTLVLDIDSVRSASSAQQTGPGATVVQDATPAKRPRLVVWLVSSALLFSLIGAGLAVAVVVGLDRRDRRLRTRDDMADALGSPVIGSVKSHRVRNTAGWSLLLQGYTPSPVDTWSLRQVLDRIGAGPLLASAGGRGSEAREGRLTVAIVLLADDPGALAVAGQLASHTASLGVTTHLTARQRHAAADALWATSARGEETRPNLRVDPRRPSTKRATSSDLVLELTVIDRQQPVLPDLRRADAIVLVVSAGTATEEDLARVAVAAYESGGRFRGIVVADPDTLDHTTGRLLQAQRAVEPPMPMKLTGVETDEWRERDGGSS
jgi:capsular polysaccharide biosynthesis protein